MRFDFVTLFPEMFSAVTGAGITGRALSRGLVEVGLYNPRDYTADRYQTVDDRPYGGGPGMVMLFEPLRDAIRDARGSGDAAGRVIYLSPQGRKLDQAGLEALSRHSHLILVCGRYEGIDERLIQAEVDEEWSIGDYVLSGGELAAMVMMDGITRLLPDALGHEDSAQQDSFSDGLLDFPQFTRPEMIEGRQVPPVLLSGDHKAIERWRLKQALGRTWLRRPDLLETFELDEEQQTLLAEFIHEQDIE
ncbi:tRNA (guanosine(37)-N1)-methyltransferase TrmD [Thiohalophilus thiocyanatoxydans]|uniref:tRNA (guanine-N(1)-)-methyltransferase n=1 Tax=Thiohalophilus thiocyanatoxydans TaxID=381308 RepID=A0A4R8INF6_9GAMM|nr:tRNA (guanosine(37)-N1)-methyltransferase TrmD [Thiohalophilus thiocyanatoxydans]TDY02396.1 tRNA (guanine37-N(1)-) methyltransferase [Thiohalophilus thiocyanatoxydans]